jgi:hypothetical protein
MPQMPLTDQSVFHHPKESTETGRRSLGGAGISKFPTRRQTRVAAPGSGRDQ